MITIIVTREDNSTEEFSFEADQPVITLGRRPGNDVCITDLSISGKHARLSLSDNAAILEDLGSTNGTYVNGQIIKSTSVRPGDEIILGKVELRFRNGTQYAEPVAAQPAAGSLDAGANALSRHRDEPVPQHNALNERYDVPEIPAPRQAPDQHESEPGGTTHYAASRAAGDTFQDSIDESPVSDAGSSTGTSAPAFREPERNPAEQHAQSSHPLDGVEHNVVPQTRHSAEQMHELNSPSAGTSKGAVIEIKNGAKSGQILPIDKPVTTLGRPGIQIAAIMRKPDGYFLMHIESSNETNPPTLNRDSIGDEPVLLHSGDALTVAGIDVEFMLS